MVASPWEHLQSVVNQVFTRRVREAFSDVSGADTNITTPRGSLRLACLPNDRDTAPMLMIRMLLFYFVITADESLRPNLYTMPSDRYQQSIAFAPQVTLYFREDIDEVEQGFQPIDAECSFRIQGETAESFTPAKAEALARRIQSEFASGGTGYRWRKGRVKLNYRDRDRGYQFSINAVSESEGRQVLGKILSLQGDSIDAEFLSITSLGQTPATMPPMRRIYGRSRRAPRRRPVGNVRFRYAEAHIHGVPNAITLVDLSLRRSAPLLRA